MPEDLLSDPNCFRASGREELPNVIVLLGLPILLFTGVRVIAVPPWIFALGALQAVLCLWLAYYSIRRLLIRYRLSESHLHIPKGFRHMSVPLDGLKLTHEPKVGWFPGRMTVKSDSVPKPGLFYLPDSWVDGEPERERFLQTLASRGVSLDLPGFRLNPTTHEERLVGAFTRIPDGWEKGGAWTFAWAVGLAVYFALGRAAPIQFLLPALMAIGGLLLFFLVRRRRLREAGDIVFTGLEVRQERFGGVQWRRCLSDCEAVHCIYSWPVQMPRRKLVLRSNDDEHLSLTAWQIEEDESWNRLCEALRSRGCRILIEEADDRDVPHKDV